MAKLDLSALEARFSRAASTSMTHTAHISTPSEPPDSRDVDAVSTLLDMGATRKGLAAALEEIAHAAYGRARRHAAFERIAGVPFPGDPNTDLPDRLLRALPFAQEPAKNPPPPARPTIVTAESLSAHEAAVSTWAAACQNQTGARRHVDVEYQWRYAQTERLQQEASAAMGRQLSRPDASRVLTPAELAHLASNKDLAVRWFRVRTDIPCPLYGREDWDLLTDAEFFMPGRSRTAYGYDKSFARRVPTGTVRNGLSATPLGYGEFRLTPVDMPDGVYPSTPCDTGWFHDGSAVFGRKLEAGWQGPGVYSQLARESEQREQAAEQLRRQSAAAAARDADRTRGQAAYLCFTLSAGSVAAGVQPQMVSISGGTVQIPAVTVGEKGRGRDLGLLPVGGVVETVGTDQYTGQTTRSVPAFTAAVVGKTAAGKAKLFASSGPVDDSKCVVVLRTGMGFRGGNGHTGDVAGKEMRADAWGGEVKECYTFAPFPGEVVCSGSIAQGDAGRMGGGTQMVAVVPRGVVFRAYRTGRLYGAPSSHYYVFDGTTVRVATWDERCAADLWEDIVCAPKA